MGLLFPVTRLKGVYEGRITADLVTRTTAYKPGRVAPLRRQVNELDGDGNVLGTRRERCYKDGHAQVLTILNVEEIDTVAPKGEEEPRALVHADAKACGYPAVAELRDAWRLEHPRMQMARLVTFQFGDVRDAPLFMSWTGRGGDYTHSRHRAMDEAEALTREQLDALALHSKVGADRLERYKLLRSRDGLYHHLNELRDRAVGNDEIAASIRRLERELSVLDRKLRV